MRAMKRTLLLWCAIAALVVAGCDAFTDDNANGGLVGTNWTVESIGGVPVDDANPTMLFAPEGLSGNASCNTYNGPFRTDGDQIEIGELATTRMACPTPELQAQETIFLGALGDATTWEQTPDGKLILGGLVEIIAIPLAT